MPWLCGADPESANRKRRPWCGGVLLLLMSSVLTGQLLHAQMSSSTQQPTAQQDPPPVQPPVDLPQDATERVLELSLEDAIRLALQNNLDIERERFGPQIARTEVEEERAAFDPVIGLEATLSQTKVLPTTEFAAQGGVFVPREPFMKDERVAPFLKQNIVTGGDYELRFVYTRQDIEPTSSGDVARTLADPRYEGSFELTFTQPLLQGFGIEVNLAPIRRAQKDEQIAEQDVVQAILDTIFEVQENYWELVFRIQDLAAQREALKLAEDFLAENTIRVEVGTMAPIELIQAETEVKLREEDVIVAEAEVKEAEDTLKEVLNIPEIMGTWRIRTQPTDTPPFVPVSTLVVQDMMEQALKQRPDFIASQLDIGSREIARMEARNQRLPSLDFVAQGSARAFGEAAEESLGNLPDLEGYRWSFGLQFEYPLGNRSARNALLKRNLELQQALVDQRQLILTIERQIRQAVRNIESAIKRIEVTRATIVLAQTQLEAEQEKFRLGLSTSFQVLEFQRDLTDARSAATRALSDYNVELARLDQRMGTSRYGKITAAGK